MLTMQPITENYWLEAARSQPEIPTSALPAQTDVAVVGSGYTGLHAALELRRAGIDVTVLESETIGWGASSRNGGMVTPGLKAPLKKIVRMFGLETARKFWTWSLEAIEHVDRAVREHEIDCGWRRDGHLALAYKPSHYTGFAAVAAWRRDQFGYTGDALIPPGQLRTEIGTDSYYGAIADDVSGGLNPAAYVFGLARAAARSGACLVDRAAVNRIERFGRRFRLHTEKGEIEAREVLLATNGYTTGLRAGIRSGIFPVGSYIIVTEPLPPDLQAEVSPKGRMFYDTKYFLNYFRLTPDGRMLFGGRNRLTTRLDLLESAELLHVRMLEVYPQLKEIPITHSWTGKLGVTFDLMPHLGRIDGIHYAYGYAGHGVSIAGLLGKEAGALLAGTQESSLFREIRHPRNPVAHLDRLFLPFVSAYYRVLDRLS
jgi:glycine/D-amino acid oxidase-like deaminating enzyme